MHREGSTPEQKARYHAGLEDALNAGYEVLKAGGESMDAAVAAVSSMEGILFFPLPYSTYAPILPSSRQSDLQFRQRCRVQH